MNTANIGAGSRPDQEAPAADPHRKGISTLTREGLEDGVAGMRAALADEARQGLDRVEQGEENTIGGWLAYGNALSQPDTVDRMDGAHHIFGI